MSATRVHMSLSVRGALRWDKRRMRNACKWIKRDDGTAYTPDELREALLDELAEGHEVIPMADDCEGFNFKTGCPGHPVSAVSAVSPVGARGGGETR